MHVEYSRLFSQDIAVRERGGGCDAEKERERNGGGGAQGGREKGGWREGKIYDH